MKKLLFAIALSLMLSAPIHAFALDLSSLDLFSSLSDADIIRARNILSEELMKRGYLEYTLSEGEHTVGDAIRPGMYTLSVPTLMHSTCFVYSSDGELITFYSVDYDWRYHESVEIKDRIRVELLEGQVLNIRGGSMTFGEY